MRQCSGLQAVSVLRRDPPVFRRMGVRPQAHEVMTIRL